MGGGGGKDTEEESAHKVDSGEESSPAAPAGIRTRNLSITKPRQRFVKGKLSGFMETFGFVSTETIKAY